MKYLYKYPQTAFPYEELVRENVNRDRNVSEYEILDTGIFDDDRYWDVFMEVCSLLSARYMRADIPVVRQRRARPRQRLRPHHVLQPRS